MAKPNCYDCKYRKSIMGDCHSRCAHPSITDTPESPIISLIQLLTAHRATFKVEGGPINIKGNAHGIKNGWFNWPFNFDPVWLENCDGFEAKSICECGHDEDAHDGNGIGECYHNDYPSGATGCLCPEFKPTKK